MRHVYLSPHLDDAVLSCGGAIHRHTSAGEKVLVINFFCGELGGGRLSPYAQRLHNTWGNPPRPIALRRAEDAAALALLDADGHYLGLLDAVYRTDPVGSWIYADPETLTGAVHPADPVAQDGAGELMQQLVDLHPPEQNQILYAPLAVGRHVDHQVVNATARGLQRQGYRVAFYEDYPYAERTGLLGAATTATASARWSSQIIPLEAADVVAKVAAIGYYRSQLGMLFGGAEAMPSRVWAFAATRSADAALAERLWTLSGV